MTHDEARKLAVEAAGEAFEASCSTGGWYMTDLQAALDAYERAMADAGWRMVRDVGDMKRHATPMYRRGYNACRAAMLGDANG